MSTYATSQAVESACETAVVTSDEISDWTHSDATVATDRPARYGKQLVAHLGRRDGGEWIDGDQGGTIVLGAGRAELSSTPGALLLRVLGPADDVARLEDVVGRHLVRFGAKDELVVRWLRADGSPGTEQRTLDD